jgi:hypothetical protein
VPSCPARVHPRAQKAGFVADVVQVASDTQIALALVSAEVGCHLTLASVAEDATDPQVAASLPLYLLVWLPAP